MSNLTMLAVAAGLSGMLGWGLADFFAKKTIDKVGDMATLAWAHIYGVFFLSSLVLARTLSDTLLVVPTNTVEIGKIALFGALQAFVYFFAYRAFGKGKLALLNPIFSSYSGLVVVLSVIVFSEIIGGWQLACLALIFFGIISINLDQDSLAIKKIKIARMPGMKDILAATILASVWTVLWGHFVSGKDWLVYASLMYGFMTITILLLCMIQRIKLSVLSKDTWKFFFLIGLSEVIAYVGVSLGYSLTSFTSIVAVLSAAFSLPTVVLAHLFLNERITKFQISGVVLVIAGVVLISLV